MPSNTLHSKSQLFERAPLVIQGHSHLKLFQNKTSIFLAFQLLCCFDFHLNYPCPSSVICGFTFFMTIVASREKRSLLPALCIFTLTQDATTLRHYILPFLSTYSIYFIIILNYFCSLHSKS